MSHAKLFYTAYASVKYVYLQVRKALSRIEDVLKRAGVKLAFYSGCCLSSILRAEVDSSALRNLIEVGVISISSSARIN